MFDVLGVSGFFFGVVGVLLGILDVLFGVLWEKKVHRLEKSTPAVAVVTNMRYAVLQDSLATLA